MSAEPTGVAASGWRRPSAREQALAGLAVLLAGVALLYRDILFRGAVLLERDVHAIWYGQAMAVRRALAEGSWPLWEPNIGFGQPLLANPDAQVLYPATWLTLALPLASRYAVLLAGHAMLTAAGMLLLARALGASAPAAFAAALVWTFGGPFVSLASVWHHLCGAAWLPWTLLAAERALAAPGPRRAALWGVVLGVQVLAGSADYAVLNALATAGLALRHVRRPLGAADNARRLRTLAGASVLAAGLSAGLWVPTVEAARRSARWELSREDRTFWSVHPLSLLELAVPLRLHDLPLDAEVDLRLFDGREPFLPSLYVGLPALALAAAAFAGPPGRVRTLASALAVLGTALALGRHTPFHAAAAALVPPLQVLRYPGKAMVLAAFGLALLAALGVDAWRATGPRRAWRHVLGAVGALAVLASGLALFAEPLAAAASTRWLTAPALELVGGLVRSLRVTAAVAVCAALLVALRTWRGRPGPELALLLLLASGDLFLRHDGLALSGPAALVTHRSPVLDLLPGDGSRTYVYEYHAIRGAARSHLGRDDPYMVAAPEDPQALPAVRILALRTYLAPPIGALWGVEYGYDMDQRGLFAAPVARLTRFLRAAEGTPAHAAALRMGAVSRVVSLHAVPGTRPLADVPTFFPEAVRVAAVPGALPRVWVVAGRRGGDGAMAFRTLIDPTFDPAREVLLPQGPDVAAPPGPAGAVHVVRRRSDRLVVDVDVAHAGHVVFAESYDPGWITTVDGRPARLERANVAFRAVPVTAGRHRVEQVYRPWSVGMGLAVSAVSALLAVAVAMAAHRTA